VAVQSSTVETQGSHAKSAYVLLAGTSACLIASLITYRPRLHDYFVFDDFIWIRAVRNHSFPEVMHRAFTFPNGVLFKEVTLFWRPLADLYFYLAQPFGLDPAPYHAMNLVAHSLVGGLAILLLWRLGANVLVAGCAGVLFVVAPTYHFAVVWISQISEFFGAIAMLCALLAYREYLTRATRVRLYGWLTIAFVVLGFLAKESTVIVLALLPALAFFIRPEDRLRDWREIAGSLVPAYVLGGVFAAVMYLHQIENGHSYELGSHMFGNIWDYLRWMVLPLEVRSYDVARSVLAVLFLAAGVCAILLQMRLVGFLFVWTIAALIPFAGFTSGIELRYSYLAALPFTGFVLIGGFELAKAMPSQVRTPAYAVLGVGIALALVVTPMRTQDFQGYIRFQANGYQQMVDAVTHLCGPMPAGTQVYLKDVPYHDYFGTSTPSAVNLYTSGVRTQIVDEFPGLIAFVEDKCALDFDRSTWTYRRVTEF